MNVNAVATTAGPSPFGDGPNYLDYNATTPVDPRVTDAMRPFLAEHFGNPSSSHAYGAAPRAALAAARAQVAALVGADPGEVVFTGSGSEADTLAVRGVVLAALADDPPRWTHGRPHVVTQITERPAVHARLPNTLNVSISGIPGHTLLARSPRVAASTGSACHSGQTAPSPVLTAMGCDTARALAAVRFSLGRWTTSESIAQAADALSGAARTV